MKHLSDYPLNIIFEIPPVLESNQKCAIDSELYGMDKDRLHRPILLDGSPNGSLACVTFCFNGVDVYMVTDEKDVAQSMENVKDAVWIFANYKFDRTQLKRCAPMPVRQTKVWDIITVEKILYSGYYDRFSLADLTRRRLGVYLPKESRELFEDATEMTEEMVTYSAYDPVFTWHVYQSQKEEIRKRDKNVLKLWKDVDLPGINAVMSMSGIKPDVEGWYGLADEATEKRQAIEEKYPDVNLASSKQISEIIVKNKFKLPKTEKGNYKTDAKTLSRIKNPDEFVQDLVTFSGLKTLTTTYGRKFIDNALEPDGRIYADFDPNGAGTGRFSCSNPNLQNIPNKVDPRYRDMFIADEGNILIVGDWSTQEPRIYAYLTQDRKLIEIFNNDLDVYIEAAKLMYGWELDKKDPRRKSPMKPTVLGACYNLTGYGMEEQYGIPKDEGQEHIDTFFSVFQDAARWNEKQRQRTDYVETIYGRKFWLNSYSWKSKNNAQNSPVQGSASDAMKQAAWCFCERWKATEKSPIVNIVHDEIVIEIAESAKDSAIECLQRCMVYVEETMHPGIKAKADIGWGKTWSCKI